MNPACHHAKETFPGLARLEELIEHKTIVADGNLSKLQDLANTFGCPQDQFKSFFIAGTNGKGTTSSYLAAISYAAFGNTGQFCSPHLFDVTERCLLNGTPCPPELLDRALAQVLREAEKHHYIISYFELVTLATFLVFAERRVARGVIEVGVGGRLDATNILARPEVSVITSIGFDHVSILGNTLSLIAREKAGVLRPGVPVVCGVRKGEAQDAITALAKRFDAPAEFLGRDFEYSITANSVCTDAGEFFLPDIGLVADHQFHNAAVAVRAAQLAGFSETEIARGLSIARWPGRLEKFSVSNTSGEKRDVLIDGAHNEDGVRALINYLECYLKLYPQERIIFVISILSRKDWRTMIELFRSFAGSLCPCEFIFTTSENDRAESPDLMRHYFGNGIAVPSPEAAVRGAIDRASQDALVVVSGSLYLIGRVRALLTEAPFSTIHVDS